MKRGADKQLTKDIDASDDETEEVPESFKKADDAVLATREIRGLPKRTAGGSVPTSNGTSTPESFSAPKFSGFTGFGNLSASSAFTFAAPASLQSSAETQPQSAGTSSITPLAVSSTATSTAKTLASFLGAPPDALTAQKPTPTGSTSSLAFPLVKQSTAASTLASAAAPTPPAATVEPTPATNDSAIKYYTELRGLNVSLLTAVTKAIQDDAFVDITLIIEQYKTHRTKIQDDYDRAKKAEVNKVELSNSKPPPAMPIPPSSFSFGNKTFGLSSKSSEPSNEGGFKPTLLNIGNAPTSSFKFPSIAPASSPEFSEIGKSTTFGMSSGNSVSSAFGSFSKSDPSSNTKFSSSTTIPATSPFGGSGLFGSSSSSNVFTQATSATPKLGVFGKPSGNGSIGNPVGFGFGAASSKDSNSDTASKTTSTSGFSFGQQSSSFGVLETEKEPKKSDEEEGGEEESVGDDASAPTDGDDATKPRLSEPSPHDAEGEGEEDEETRYSVKLKAYRMKKPDESGGQGWAELGIGYLRLKKHKETNARRMLLRSSSTGRICINFRLYPGLKVTQTKKNLTFVGHGNGIPQSYNIRLPNEDQARQLKEAIEGEIVHLDPQEG